MDRLFVFFAVLIGLGLLWLAWRGANTWLRRSIQVDEGTLNSDRPALLYFSSPDCAPCRLLQAPILDSLRNTFGNCVHFQEYDAVAQPEFARRYRVLTVPTTVVIGSDGDVVAINYGVAQADKLHRQLLEAGAVHEENLLSPCLA
jgi:thioredoxin 1